MSFWLRLGFGVLLAVLLVFTGMLAISGLQGFYGGIGD
jgi:hypothetical protein